MLSEPFRTIADKTTTEQKLTKALAALPKAVGERPEFWNKIANDPSYRRSHRSLVIVTLFRRHIHPGMFVNETARILNRPSWLHEGDVDAIWGQRGWIPVRRPPGGTALCLNILPVKGADYHSVYFGIEGRVHDENLRRVLAGYRGPISPLAAKEMRSLANSRISSIGFWEEEDRERFMGLKPNAQHSSQR